MAKTTSQSQGSFSFFDEPEKNDPAPEPKKHVLRPPAQIEAIEEEVKEIEQPDDIKEAPASIDPEVDLSVDIGPEIDEGGATDHFEEEEEPLADISEAVLEEPQESEIATHEYVQEAAQERRSSRGRKSVKEHSLAAEMIEMPGDDVLYSKQYYSMGEVTAMFKENHSLIRYWESEFDILRPKKNGKGDRFFRPVDVKNLYLIYDLLRRRKFTIEGARDYLKNNKKADEKFAAVQSLEKIKAFFLELKASL